MQQNDQLIFRYVWLNIATGEFSNSWTEEEQERAKVQADPERPHWKLIKYACVNDETFMFINRMQIRDKQIKVK